MSTLNLTTLRAVTISNSGGTNTITPDNLISGACKAWVNFNGTGTVAIRASFNVSSITDNGVGDYTVNFTTAMTDANYGVAMAGQNGVGGAATQILGVALFPLATNISTSARCQARDIGGNVAVDITHFHAVFYR